MKYKGTAAKAGRFTRVRKRVIRRSVRVWYGAVSLRTYDCNRIPVTHMIVELRVGSIYNDDTEKSGVA